MAVLGSEAPAAFWTRQPTIWPSCRRNLRLIGKKVTLNLTSRAGASAIGTTLECFNLNASGTRGMLADASGAVTLGAVLEYLRIMVVLVRELCCQTARKPRLTNSSLKLCFSVACHVERHLLDHVLLINPASLARRRFTHSDPPPRSKVPQSRQERPLL